MLTEKEMQEVKKNVITAHYASYYDNCIQQGWDVKMLLDTEDEHRAALKKMEEEIIGLKKEVDALSDKKDKLSRTQLRVKKDVLQARGIYLNTLVVNRSDLYKIVIARTAKIMEGMEKMKFREQFDGFIPKLPFIEIEGTRFQSTKDNDILTDEKGMKVLYLKPDDKTGTDKKA